MSNIQKTDIKFLLISMLIVMCSIILRPILVEAQYLSTWSAPQVLFSGEGDIHDPIIKSDINGKLHVFWVLSTAATPDEAGFDQLFYTQKQTDQVWSDPTDIVFGDSIIAPDAAIDYSGHIHLIWSASNHLLYYSRTNNDNGTDLKEWSPPLVLGTCNFHADLLVDKDGGIHVVYPGAKNEGVEYIFSNDSGETWSTPSNVSSVAWTDSTAENAKLAITDDGTIHVVWTEYQTPTGWPPLGIFYSRSKDQGRTWDKPRIVAGRGYDQVNIDTYGYYDVHLVWNGMAGVMGRYHQYSRNGGVSWSDISTLTPDGGTEGYPQIAVIEDNEIQLVTSFNNCAWYATWKNDSWSKFVCLANEEALSSNYIEEPAMNLSEGNQINVVFWDDRKRLWYTSYSLPYVSHIAPIAYATTEITPTTIPTIILDTSVPQVTKRIVINTLTPKEAQASSSINPGNIFLVSVLPSIAIIIVFLIIFSIRKTRLK